MKIIDLPKARGEHRRTIDRPREKLMKKSCAVCGAKIVVMLHVNRTYTGGHCFGRIPLHTKKDMLRAIKAGTHKVRFAGGTLNVMNKDPKPYTFMEYCPPASMRSFGQGECKKCYINE